MSLPTPDVMVAASSPTSPASPPALASPPETRPRELTARALLTGALLGAMLAAGNVYTGLKASSIDGGSITAALLSFAFFASFGRLWGGSRLSAQEVNVAQTTASSAAVLSFVGGLMGPIPAMALEGLMPPLWVIFVWALTLGMFGSLLAWGLREKLVVRENLPFPTGAATAEVITALVANERDTWRSTRGLLVSTPVAAFLTWLRDKPSALIPQALVPGWSIRGLSLSQLTGGLALSPLMCATGVLMGVHTSASFVAGGIVSWLLVGPWLAARGVVPGNYAGIEPWFLWPAFGLLTTSTLVPLLFDGPALLRAWRDLRGVVSSATPEASAVTTSAPRRDRFAKLALAALSALGIIGLSGQAFGLELWESVLLVVLVIVFGAVCGRAAGETDMAPIGAMGTLTQAFFGRGIVRSLGAGSAVAGASSQLSQSLWAFKTAHRLGASPTASLYAQWLGLLVGAVVVVPVYLVIVKAYGLATPALPAVSALTWRTTAQALRGGLDHQPWGTSWALGLGTAAGTLLALLARARPRLARLFPSPVGFALGLITPFSLSLAALLGAGGLALWRRYRPMTDGEAIALASGGMVGESLMGVLLAVWLCLH